MCYINVLLTYLLTGVMNDNISADVVDGEHSLYVRRELVKTTASCVCACSQYKWLVMAWDQYWWWAHRCSTGAQSQCCAMLRNKSLLQISRRLKPTSQHLWWPHSCFLSVTKVDVNVTFTSCLRGTQRLQITQLANINVNDKTLYVAHRRRTSNALQCCIHLYNVDFKNVFKCCLYMSRLSAGSCKLAGSDFCIWILFPQITAKVL